MNDSVAVAKTITEQLLKSLHIEAVVTVDSSTERPTLMIESPDQALLIGRSGDNLRALQHLLNTLLRRQVEGSQFISIDIAGYRKERSEKLQAIAQTALEEVLREGKTVRLKPMNAYERRQVHMYLADNAEVVTESEGSDPHRIVVIKRRAN